MAAFTDDPVKLTPYIAQQPIEAMASVGMQREQQFQQGIDTVNSMEASLLGLPIAKKEVQDYVKQKLDWLNTNIKQSISGDFSDRRLINQIGGLASQISNDPIVQEGVQSTARIQSGMAKAKADEELNAKNGKHPTNNINDFQDQVQNYLADGKHNTKFGGDYTPYVDVIDRAIKLFKEQNPGQTLDVDAFYYDQNDLNPDGSAKLKPNPVYFKGVDPSRIQSVLNMVYSQPDVQAQLSVDGRQTFKGMDQVAMSDYLTKNANEQIDMLETTIRQLQIEGVTNGTADKKQINAQIDFYKKQYDELVKENKTNNEILLGKNPESLKSKLVWENTKANFLKAYAYKDPQSNPFFDKWLEKAKFEETLKMNQHTIDQDKLNYDLKLNEILTKSQETKGKDGIIAAVSTMGVDAQQAVFTPKDAQTEITEAQNNYTQDRRKLASTLATQAGQVPPFIEDSKGMWIPNIQKYKTIDPNVSPETAEKQSAYEAKQLLDAANLNYNAGKITDPNIINLYQQSEKSWDNLQNKKARVESIEAQFKPELDKIKQDIGNPDFASAYIVDNKIGNWQKEEEYLSKKYGAGTTDITTGQAPLWKVNMGLLAPKYSGYQGADVSYTKEGAKNNMAYQQAISKLNNKPEYLDITQRYNEAYRQASTTTASKIATLKVEGENYDISRNQLNAIIEPLLHVPGGATSEAEAFKKAQEKGKFESMHVYYDANDKIGIIEGYDGKKLYKVKVPAESIFTPFPQLRPNTWFEENYRAKLDYARTTSTPNTTDVGAKGRVGSYLIPSNDPDYIVQHHIVIQNGQYNIRYWITPKSNPEGPSIINGQYYFDTPVSETAIEKVIKEDLSNPQMVALLVKQATQNK